MLRAALRNYDHTLGRRLRITGIDPRDIDAAAEHPSEPGDDARRGPPAKVYPRVD